MKVLHMVRKKADSYPMDIAAAQKAAGDEVKVVLLQDAVLSCKGDAGTFCCKEDAEARGVGCGTQVDYNTIVKMIFEADRVVNW
jgi:sulfur transfer complex TusBCD TusB component (DsrH family)